MINDLKEGDLVYHKSYKSYMVFLNYSPSKIDSKIKNYCLVYDNKRLIVVSTKNISKVKNDTKV